MEQFDGDVNHFDNRHSGDSAIHARFYLHPVLDEEASKAAGRPVHKELEYVEIVAPGNQNNIIKRPARQMDIERFSRQYSLFKDKSESQVVGTRLSDVTWLTRGQVEDLSLLRIHTVEQLAGLSDSVCSQHTGLYDLKGRAARYMADALSPMAELKKKNEELAAANADLSSKVERLLEALEKHTSNGATSKKG